MTTKANAHFVDSDITGTSGLDNWQSANYEYPPSDPNKISISTAEQLQKISYDADYPSNGDYELANDIDCGEIAQWQPIGGRHIDNGGENQFTGTFDGRYYTISNVTYDQSLLAGDDSKHNGVGFFGEMISATVERVVLTNVVITMTVNARSSSVGLLFGQTTATTCNVRDCYVQGTITITSAGGSWYGGIGGRILGSGSDIDRCGADVVINATNPNSFNYAGLLMGYVAGIATTITDCYGTGTISEGAAGAKLSFSGGLIGGFGNTPIITNCYSAVVFSGTVLQNTGGFAGNTLSGSQTYTDCFWDGTIETLGLADHGEDGDIANITESTTTLMQTESTFTDVSWDFNNIWQIDEGNDYPRHIWKSGAPYKIQTGLQQRTTAMPIDHAHLNGETVQVLGDGSYLGTDTVSGGDITLDDNTTVNHVGLAYTSTILPMKINGEVNVKRISKIIPNVNETVGGDYGRSVAKLTSMVLRASGDPLDTDGALFTGHVDLPFDGTLDRSADIYITQDEPLPMKLLGLGVVLSEERI